MKIEMKQRCRSVEHAKGFVLNENYIFPGIPIEIFGKSAR